MRSRTILVALPALVILACTSEQTPTEPDTPEAPVPPSLALASNTWTPKAPLPFGPCGVDAGLAVNSAGQSTVYVFGGVVCDDAPTGFEVQAYNVATNTWSRKNTTVYSFFSNGVGKIGGKFYWSGGYQRGSETFASYHTYAYDFASDRLIRKADMPKATADGVSGVINGKLYVLPGTCEGAFWPAPKYCATEPIKQLYRYDPVTNTWATLAEAPHYHKSGAGGVINGKFYVAAGFSDFIPVAELDVYDPATNTWTTRASMPAAGLVTGAAVRNKLFVLSGTALYVYDPVTNVWKTKTSSQWPHPAATRVMIDGKGYFLAVGGSHHGTDFDIPNDSELFTP